MGTINELSQFYIQGSQGSQGVHSFRYLMLQWLYLELCIGSYGNNDLVICYGWWYLSISLTSQIFFKKCSLYESPEEDEWEVKFSSSEVTHNLHQFHHCFILLSHLLKQFYILGCKQLMLAKYSYSWTEQTVIGLSGHYSDYCEASKQNSDFHCMWQVLLKCYTTTVITW